MKKTLSLMAIFVAVSNAFAGGLLTNTNQNAAFVRNFAQEGKIDLTSIYANPAGGAFLSNGWHLSLNSQTAFQERNIETTFPLFVTNADDPNRTHRFEGKAKAPVIPSFTVSYNRDKWSVSAHFAIGGGGGKCEFDKGLGSFEATYAGMLAQKVPAVLPGLLTQGFMQAGMDAATASAIAGTGQYTGYAMNSFMKGRSYHFGLQLGATYKFAENIAGFLGVRGVYATCNYNGAVSPSIRYTYDVPNAGTMAGSADLGNYGIALNCDQTGFGATLILGADWKIDNHWNVSAKYEAPTRLNLKNKSEIAIESDEVKAAASSVLGQFEDGEHVREDIPAILALGVQYSPIEQLRLSAGYHQFFDKVSTKYLDKQKFINHNTHEFLIGAEYDACKLITVSASWEITRYGLADEFMNDLSFNLSNHMLGAGVRINATKRCSIDLGYMYTFYNSRDVVTQTAAGPKTDHYDRKNQTFGIGVNLHI